MTRVDPRVTPWQIDESGFPTGDATPEKLRFLLRYAILAPSTHNIQPWKFSVGDNEILVFADKMRWLRVADAAQRELHISVGCAIENLLTAARYFGYKYEIRYTPAVSQEDVLALVASVKFEPANGGCAQEVRHLLKAVTSRCTNRRLFKSTAIPQDTLQILRSCVAEEGLSLYLISDADLKERFHRLVIEADAIQFADPAFRDELTHWIGQSGYGLPWLTSKLVKLAVKYGNVGESTTRIDTEILRSTPALGLICSQADDWVTYISVGRVLERIFLTATDLDLSLQPMGQVCEVPSVRARLAALIPEVGLYPQQPFRLGYAKPEPGHTPRRPLEEVLIP